MGKFSTTQLFGMTIRESANDGSDFTNPAADYRRLFLGEDGTLKTRDSAGTVATISAGLTSSTGDSTADVTLTADTIADATGASLSLAAGTWFLAAQVIFQGSSSTFDYTLAAITDGSNTVVSEVRGNVNNLAPTTVPIHVIVAPGSTTTYKIRGQSGRTNNKILRYSSSTNIGTRLVAVKIV